MTASALEDIEGFRDEWPFAALFARVNGWRMHYIDEGEGRSRRAAARQSDLGIPLPRLIAPLVAGRRVIVPDMIGFGLSEKPTREQAHTLDGHTANLTALMRQLDLQRRSRLSATIGEGRLGFRFAMSNPERIRALTVMSTWAWPTPPAEFHTRMFPWRMMHAPLVGPYLLGRHKALAGAVSIFRSWTGRSSPRRRRRLMRPSCRTRRHAC